MSFQLLLPSNKSHPPDPTSYQTAYCGIVYDQDGNFHHFVRQIDSSHLENGYWKFQSVDDDRRAFSRGFTTPEALLVAADRTDEKFDDITLRWVRGTSDPNLNKALIGTASQHLQTMYEVRHLLSLPMSLRGQIPLYPVTVDARLKQYWEDKYNLQWSITTGPASHSAPLPATHCPDTPSRSQSNPMSPPVQGLRENPVAKAPIEQKSRKAPQPLEANHISLFCQTKATQTTLKQHLTESASCDSVAAMEDYSSTPLQQCPPATPVTMSAPEHVQDQREDGLSFSSPVVLSSSSSSSDVDDDGISPPEFVHRQPTASFVGIGTSVGTPHTPCIRKSAPPISSNMCQAPKVDTLQATTFPQERISSPRYYAEEIRKLPCTDYGNDDGHKPECHIGSKQICNDRFAWLMDNMI